MSQENEILDLQKESQTLSRIEKNNAKGLTSRSYKEPKIEI